MAVLLTRLPLNEIIYDELRPCPHTWCTIAVAKEAGKGSLCNAIIRINIADPVVRIRGSMAGRTQDHFKVVCDISRGNTR